MDLNSFISNAEKRIYKITYNIAESRITRFLTASSKENAKYLLEQDFKKDNPESKFKIISIEDLAQKHKGGGLDVQGLGR